MTLSRFSVLFTKRIVEACCWKASVFSMSQSERTPLGSVGGGNAIQNSSLWPLSRERPLVFFAQSHARILGISCQNQTTLRTWNGGSKRSKTSLRSRCSIAQLMIRWSLISSSACCISEANLNGFVIKRLQTGACTNAYPWATL